MTALLRLALHMRPGRTLLFAAALPLFTLAAAAQSAPNPPSTLATTAVSGNGFADPTSVDALKDHMLRNMAVERDKLRQKAIADDTARLLRLAEQLKTAVDKSDKDQLSLQVVNTASEIEKLAKTVKDKMRDGH